jgi:uncharacterized protein (DUF58 family)
VETTDLIKKLRKIEIRTRGLSRQVFAGEYHSAFRGKGISFSEVREYNFGDDIRNIDWNVTARFNHPFVRVYEEERELTVILMIDVSGSGFFGTTKQFKSDTMTEIAALLSFSAIANNDKIGVVFFSDKVEKFIPPQKGRKHILRVIRELIDFKPEHKASSLDEPLRFITNAIKKRSIVFVISDFIMPEFHKPMQIASGKHDVVAVRVYDKREAELPDIGFVKVKDSESGGERWIDTSPLSNRARYAFWWNQHSALIKNTFRRCGVDYAEISTEEDYVRPLINLFKRR